MALFKLLRDGGEAEVACTASDEAETGIEPHDRLLGSAVWISLGMT